MKMIYILMILAFSTNVTATAAYSFTGESVSLNKECISQSLPSILLSGDNIIVSDDDGIVAFGVVAESGDKIFKSMWMNVYQILRFDHSSFLGGIANIFKGDPIQSILKNRVNKVGWPLKANTKISISIFHAKKNKHLLPDRIRNIHLIALDGCGKTSILSISHTL